jgi:hypothetical protein
VGGCEKLERGSVALREGEDAKSELPFPARFSSFVIILFLHPSDYLA